MLDVPPPLPPGVVRSCYAAPRESPAGCSLRTDLDGDGKPDWVTTVQQSRGPRRGFVVHWGKGGFTILGAGVRHTWGVVQDEPPAKTQAMTQDFTWLTAWAIWPVDQKGGPRGFLGKVGGKPNRFLAPTAAGDGIYLDGGDSAAVLYRVGTTWRLDYLGF